MEPFIDRIRVRLRDYDPIKRRELRSIRRQMRQLLRSKKIIGRKALKAMDEAMTFALDCKFDPLRRKQYLRAREAEQRDLEKLVTAIDALRRALSKLDLGIRRELNKITAKQDWNHFDTEVLVEFIDSIIEKLTLPEPPPTESRSGKSTRLGWIRQVVTTEGQKIKRLWETVSPATRTDVEASVRRRLPSTSAAEVLRHLRHELSRYEPAAKKPRGTSRVFDYRMTKLWRELGLRTGRVYHGGSKTCPASHSESAFQHFGRLAMAAVGGSTKISSRFVLRLNSEGRQGKRPPTLRH